MKQKRKKGSDRPCIKPVLRQNKSRPAPFRTIKSCANEAAVTNLRNYTNNKSKLNKRFLLFLVEQKVSRGKLSFLHTLFLENDAQIHQDNCRTMRSCQNKSVCEKLARSCKKMKIGQNPHTPFLRKGLQLEAN